MADAKAQTPLVHVENVHKRYGRKRILEGLSLQIHAGDIVALLGANGSGKTTLIRIICGLERPTRGEVWFERVPLSRASNEIRRYVGVVSHAPLLYEDLSGWENLQFFAQLYGLAEPASRIESVLSALDLWGRRHDAVRAYSRGMVQRLAIGRAILHDPPVLLLDEPDTGLDQTSIHTLTNLLAALGQSRRAVLLTTHHVERAMKWADRLVFLSGGHLTADRPTEALQLDEAVMLYEKWG